MLNTQSTEHEKKLAEALRARRVEIIVHYKDGHKTVDIYIWKARK